MVHFAASFCPYFFVDVSKLFRVYKDTFTGIKMMGLGKRGEGWFLSPAGVCVRAAIYFPFVSNSTCVVCSVPKQMSAIGAPPSN